MEWNGHAYKMWEEKGDSKDNKDWGRGWYFTFTDIPNCVIEGPFDCEGQASQVLQARIDEMK